MTCAQGEFLETSQELFGLSSMALEQVACQGLACVVHMNLQVSSVTVILYMSSAAAGSIVTKEYSI